MYSTWNLALSSILSVLLHLVLGSPTVNHVHHKSGSAQPRPLVLWHGMGLFKYLLISCPLPIKYFLKTGDSYASTGMLEFVSMIKDVHPGIFVHSIYIEEDLSADKRAGFVCILLS